MKRYAAHVAGRLAWAAASLAAAEIAAGFGYYLIRTMAGNLRGPDFFSFYAAGRLFVERGGSHLYDPALQLQYQRQITAVWGDHFILLPYVHPPFYTFLMAPLGLLTLHQAYIAWAAVNLVLAAAALAILVRAAGLRGRGAALASLLAAAFLPLFVVVLQGQSDCVALLALALAFVAWSKGREGWAGVLAGLAVIKPQLILLVPLLFLARRAWRAMAGFAGVLGLLTLASLPFFGLAGWIGYLNLIAPWAVGGQGSPITVQTAYSLRGLLEVAPGGRLVALVILAAALLLTFVALSWRPHRSRLDLAFAMAGSIVLSPYENLHDLALLLIPGIALAGLLQERRLRWPRAGWAVIAIGYLAMETPLWLGPAVAALGAFALAAYLAVERLAVEIEPLQLGELSWSGPRPRRVVVLPAYRAEKTLRDVVAQIPRGEVDRILLVDDASSDQTAEVALELGIDVIKHPRNLGYGGNQKTCYANALLMGAEVVVMLHPDGQYDPSLVPALCREIEEGRGEVALGSRWLGLDPARAGMPWWKRLGNRFLTGIENRVLSLRLSEYHTGYRAYSRRFLETVPFEVNSDDFVFDQQVLVQAAAFGFPIAEIPAVGRYFEDMSSTSFKTSVVYGLKTLAALVSFLGHRAGLPCRWLVPHLRAHPLAAPARS